MPGFVLPTGSKGWLVALLASLIGMIAGGVSLNVLGRALA